MHAFGGITMLRYLDQSVTHIGQIGQLKTIFDRIEKCRTAVYKKNLNLADIISDPNNCQFFKKIFDKEYDIGIQLLLRLTLDQYSSISFTINKDIVDEDKIHYLYRAVGGWKNFDTVILFYCACCPQETTTLINPLQTDHWNTITEIPAETVATIYVKGRGGSKLKSQENLALQRYQEIFETVQNLASIPQGGARTSERRQTEPEKVVPMRKAPVVAKKKKRRTVDIRAGLAGLEGKLVRSLRFVISKIDTFVHAGNAHLIISHLRGYKGTVKMYVIRGEKELVRMDADSIWGKEIRNGESVLYEFYGDEAPSEIFLKELMMKTNKYTQMDKLGE